MPLIAGSPAGSNALSDESCWGMRFLPVSSVRPDRFGSDAAATVGGPRSAAPMPATADRGVWCGVPSRRSNPASNPAWSR